MKKEYFSTRYSFDQGRVLVWKAICEYLQRFIPHDSVVADLGAGYGDFINQISAQKKYGFDINPEVKQFLNKDVTIVIGDLMTSLQVEDEIFDIIFASNFFEHFEDQQLDTIFGEIFRCLKSGGKLIIIQPNYYYSYREYWDDFTHRKAFTHNSLPDYLESKGFSVLWTRKKFLPFSCKSLLPKSYWLTKAYLYSPIKPFGKQMLIVACKER